MASAAQRRALGHTAGGLATPSIRVHAFDAHGLKPGVTTSLPTAPKSCSLGPCRTPTCHARRPCHSVQRRGLTIATAVPPTVQSAQGHGVTLQAVLSALRQVHGIDRLDPDAEAVVSGRGRHLGVGVSWVLRWSGRLGAFREEIRGQQLTFRWGYDGRPGSGCWEVDSSGTGRIMECDDHEAVLITTYVRTGCWLLPHLQDRFDIELLPPPPLGHVAGAGQQQQQQGAAGRADSGSRSGASSSRDGSEAGSRFQAGGPDAGSGGAEQEEGEQGRQGRGRAGASGSGGGSGTGVGAAADLVALGIRLKGCKLRVRVLVRRRDWRVLGFDHRLCADTETWEFGEWKEWAPGVVYPTSALHKASNGGQHAYITHEGAAEPSSTTQDPASAAAAAMLTSPSPSPLPFPTPPPSSPSTLEPNFQGPTPEWGGELYPLTATASGLDPGSRPGPGLGPAPGPSRSVFEAPLLPPTPADTSYSFSGQQRVPLWRAGSGHLLVRPVVNGQDGGYFILDSGASGFVVTPQAAARLGGTGFGETYAASMNGKVSARFLRLSSWSLGGLSISQPVMMVMELGGLVRGAPGEVVGIVGYDLFRRAVVQLPQLLPASHGAAGWHQGEALEASGGQGCGSGSEGEEGYSGSGGESPVGSWDGDGEEIGGEEAGQTRGRDGAWGVWGRQGSVASGPQPPQPRPQSTPAFGEEDGLGTGKGGSGSGSGSDAEVAPAKAQSVAVAAAASAHSSMDGPNSTSSSSSGGGSARQEAAAPEGGRRRSAGRSATARLWRRAAQRVPYTRLEAVLHHPLEFRGEAEWEWHPLIMIANLPHIRVSFPDPRDPSSPTLSALLMVDSGACGADLMLHARAQKELGLAGVGPGQGQGRQGGGAGAGSKAGTKGGGGGGGEVAGAAAVHTEGHYLRGVGTEPKDMVQLQVMDLPWLDMAGVRFEQVRCMCASSGAMGGLDISVYSSGILCGDLLARTELCVDVTRKRIGFRRGARAPPPAPAVAAAAAGGVQKRRR